MTAKKAVDVVLLGDDAIQNRAIELNRMLLEQFGDEIVLDKDSCLPHVSLAMGCLEENLIDEFGKKIFEIAGQSEIGKLEAVRIITTPGSSGREVAVLEIQGRGLRGLHENIMRACERYFSSDADESMIYGGRAGQGTLDWICGYRENSSFEKFFPHITLGYGRIADKTLPFAFQAATLAICHLGNHCTCRNVLWSMSLRR